MGKCVGGVGKEESEAIDLTEASATILGGGGNIVWASTDSSWSVEGYCGGAGEGSRFGVTAREDASVSCSEGRREEYSGAGLSSMGVPGTDEGFCAFGTTSRVG